MWTHQARLTSSSQLDGAQFGQVVAIDGDTVVVGAPNTTTGEACVFVRSNGTWTQEARLTPSDPGQKSRFGWSVSIHGDTAVVGAPNEAQGAAYVFLRNGQTWTQEARLTASNAEGGDQFGYRVAVFGDTVVVSGIQEASAAAGVDGDQADNSRSGAGAAYVFTRSGTMWTQQAYLKASNPDPGDVFGISVALFGDTLAVAATDEASTSTGVNGNQLDNSAPSAGAVYIFVRVDGSWAQEAYVKASNTDARDGFGGWLSLDGDTLVVGAGGESSDATGVGGDQLNNAAPIAGAAYVFTRSDGNWSQQAYLKPSNPDAKDGFACVAISGQTIVVGAPSEAGGPGSGSGDPGDNSVPDSGAAYVFAFAGGAWTQTAYLKSSAPHKAARFGRTAVSGKTIVVGADSEDNLRGAAYVFVADSHPPTAAAGPDQTVEATSPAGAWVSLGGSGSTDPDGDLLTFRWTDAQGAVLGSSQSASVLLALGTHVVTLTVDDGHGGTATDSVTVVVRDSTSPKVKVLSPGTQTLFVGMASKIQWTATDAVGVVSTELEHSLDSGGSYDAITTVSGGALSYSWIPTDETPAGKVRVRARDKAGNVGTGVSNGSYRVVKPSLAVGNLQKTVKIGKAVLIKVRYNFGAGKTIKIEVNYGSGTFWVPISTVTTTVGTGISLGWQIAGPQNSYARIRATLVTSVPGSSPVTSQSDPFQIVA